jgi:hypothetical protein
MEQAEYIKTNRGGKKLLYRGFSFTTNRKFKGGVISWKCTKYKQFKCHARIVTKVMDEVDYVKISKPLHTHPPDNECKKDRLKIDVISDLIEYE